MKSCSATASRQSVHVVRTDGTQANVLSTMQTRADLYDYLDYHAYEEKLDALFAASSDVLESPPDISGMVGQDAQGNEPSNHIPYLYNFAGAAWKTQERVRQIARLHNNAPQGVPGNDDCGQISTWFVFAALGFSINSYSDEFMMIARDGIELAFGLNPQHDPKTTAGSIYVRVTSADALPLWCPRKDLEAPAYEAERNAFRTRQLQEYRRLLYVALLTIFAGVIWLEIRGAARSELDALR